MEKDPGQRQRNAADPRGDAVCGIPERRDRSVGGQCGLSAGRPQDPVEQEHQDDRRGHVEAGRDPAPDQLDDLAQGDQPEGKTEHAFLRQEINADDGDYNIIAEGGRQAHPEHPAVENQHVQQVQCDIRDRHGQYAHDEQRALAGHLQERYHDQGAHATRCADAESPEIALRHLMQFPVRAGPHGPGQETGKQENNRHEQQRDPGGDRQCGRVSRVRLLPGAGAEGFAAGYLDARRKQRPDRPDGEQQRIRQDIGGHRLFLQEPADHDIVNQQTQRNCQRRKNLR